MDDLQGFGGMKERCCRMENAKRVVSQILIWLEVIGVISGLNLYEAAAALKGARYWVARTLTVSVKVHETVETTRRDAAY